MYSYSSLAWGESLSILSSRQIAQIDTLKVLHDLQVICTKNSTATICFCLFWVANTPPQQTTPHINESESPHRDLHSFLTITIFHPLTHVSTVTFQSVKAFLTSLYQRHIVMVGFPIVAVGYEVGDDTIQRYLRQHHISGLRDIQQLLRRAESELSIPVSLVSVEDFSVSIFTPSRKFLCCYVDTRTRVCNCEELMAVIVPPQFTRVKEILGIDGDLKRIFALDGTIVSYDANGKTRVREQCVIGV